MKNPRDSRALILSGFPVMNSIWMGTQMVQLYLATRCGSPREFDGQYRSRKWSDPPRSPLYREWVAFLSNWHRIIHHSGPDCRQKGWPVVPPTIFKFCQKFDLPVAPWAIDNARRHGWTDLIEVADELNARHAHLASLSQETRE